MIDAFLFNLAKRPSWKRGISRAGGRPQAFIAWTAVCQIRVKSSTGDCACRAKIGNWPRWSLNVVTARCGFRRAGLNQNGSASGRIDMAFRSSTRRALLLAGTFGTLVAAWPAMAQQAQPLPPGSPLIGRPENEGAMKLAPVAPPPEPATAEKVAGVVDKLTISKGFKLEV